jgi:hypothetical protein
MVHKYLPSRLPYGPGYDVRGMDRRALFFLGPRVTTQTTRGERSQPFFSEFTLNPPHSMGREGEMHVKLDDLPRTPASGDLAAHVEMEAEELVTVDLLCEGASIISKIALLSILCFFS